MRAHRHTPLQQPVSMHASNYWPGICIAAPLVFATDSSEGRSVSARCGVHVELFLEGESKQNGKLGGACREISHRRLFHFAFSNLFIRTKLPGRHAVTQSVHLVAVLS